MDTVSQAVRLDAPLGVRERLSALTQAAGLRHSTAAGVTLVAVAGRHLPDSLNALMVDSEPHLVLRVLPERVVVGPFVSPGVTACARCVAVSYAEESEDASAALAHAFSSPPAGLGPSVPPTTWALLTLGMGLAARDLHAWHRGASPSTWSATWEVTAEGLPVLRRWRRHPWCGCGWFDGTLT
ncbi:MAG: hypothetical protein ACI379_02830 [Nocardioides sp.]|uniref:hypothetical protein n=1 Tax=Nocardioides sp. TaxID=35761 RepID=UPI003EFDE967